jgi:GNAT superfamily N-acetyltransferase
VTRIRAATPTDAPGLVEGAFAELGHPASAAQLAGRLARVARDETYEAWVAVEDNVLIGFAAGHILHPMEDDAPAAQLFALFVSANARGSRLGSHLCEAFESWALERGALRTVVTSGTHRQGAHRFYEKCGYEPSGLRFGKKLR